MTTDADLAINAVELADVPEIGEVLRAAGFTAGQNPGHWVAVSDIAVDLMVVPHQAGTTKATARAAKLSPHEPFTARIARGLEPALVDNAVVTLRALEEFDRRSYKLHVAGPAARLMAKAIKIGERLEQSDRQPDRLKEKDALDMFRLLQAIDTTELVDGFQSHFADEHAAAVTWDAIRLLRTEGSTPEVGGGYRAVGGSRTRGGCPCSSPLAPGGGYSGSRHPGHPCQGRLFPSPGFETARSPRRKLRGEPSLLNLPA